MPYQDALSRVIEEVIEPGAAEVDASAIFPRGRLGHWQRLDCWHLPFPLTSEEAARECAPRRTSSVSSVRCAGQPQ